MRRFCVRIAICSCFGLVFGAYRHHSAEAVFPQMRSRPPVPALCEPPRCHCSHALQPLFSQHSFVTKLVYPASGLFALWRSSDTMPCAGWGLMFLGALNHVMLTVSGQNTLILYNRNRLLREYQLLTFGEG